MISSVLIKTDEGVLVLDVVTSESGAVQRATLTVYEYDGARMATLDAAGADLAQRALCPPRTQGPGSEGTA